MNLFDRFLDSFSAKTLNLRVRAVTAFGILLCAAVVIGGIFFLKIQWETDVSGTGAWTGENLSEIDVVLDGPAFERAMAHEPLAVKFFTVDGKEIEIESKLVAIDPEKKTLLIEAEDVAPEIKTPGRFNLKLVILKKTFWELLLRPESSTDENK